MEGTKSLAFNIEQYRNLFTPRHIVAGLGSAERNLLALSLALFDDGTFANRLSTLYEQTLNKARAFTQREVDESVQDIRSRMYYWIESHYSDSELRLFLWIYLRRAFDLPPKVAVSLAGAVHLADDMASALIHTQDPPGASKSTKRWLYKKGWLDVDQPALTLVDIVLPVLDELLLEATDGAVKAEGDAAIKTDEQRREYLARALLALATLSEKDHEEFLKLSGAEETADNALRNILMAGGALGTFSFAVGSAGFSAYILAAQASAFIPFVSGPGLVSFVSVLSNPLVTIGGAGTLAYVLGKKAADRAQSDIAARIIGLLVIQGIKSEHRGLQGALDAFAKAPRILSEPGVSDVLIEQYRHEWKQLADIKRSPQAPLSDEIIQVMDRRIAAVDGKKSEQENAQLMGALTVGDLVFKAASINPAVIQATDFARIAELDSTFAFSQYAEEVLSRDSELFVGTVSNIKGYVAEFLAASQLNAQGHLVTMPETPNHEGWDLLVDGQEFQVKFHEGLGGVTEHFSRFDYPVIANEELMGKIPEALQDQVVFIDGLSNDLVTELTTDSLKAGADFVDAGIPMGALFITAWRGMQKHQTKQISGRQVVEQVIMDGTVRVGLAYAGYIAGGASGLMLFGPAGAWVFGGAVPVLSQTQTTRAINLLNTYTETPAIRAWMAEAHATIDKLQKNLSSAIVKNRRQLAKKHDAVSTGPIGDYLRWRFLDRQHFCLQANRDLDRISNENFPIPEKRMQEMTRWLASSGLFTGVYQQPLREAGKALDARPSLINSTDTEYYSAKTTEFAKATSHSASKAAKEVSKRALKAWHKYSGGSDKKD
jgi:hypothetical protein